MMIVIGANGSETTSVIEPKPDVAWVFISAAPSRKGRIEKREPELEHADPTDDEDP